MENLKFFFIKHASSQICHYNWCIESFKIIFKKIWIWKKTFFRCCRILLLFHGLKMFFTIVLRLIPHVGWRMNIRFYLPIQQSQARATTRPVMFATFRQPNYPLNDKKLMKFGLKTPNGVVTVTSKSHCFFSAIITKLQRAADAILYTKTYFSVDSLWRNYTRSPPHQRQADPCKFFFHYCGASCRGNNGPRMNKKNQPKNSICVPYITLRDVCFVVTCPWISKM